MNQPKISIKEYVKEQYRSLEQKTKGINNTMLTIIDATDPKDIGNQIYIKKKLEDCQEVGWLANLIKVPDGMTELERKVMLEEACEESIGVIVQLPTRDNISLDLSILTKKYDCDCDGLTATASCVPATPRGILDYLDVNDFKFKGKNAVVIGRSDIVGKPMARELINRDMTVTLCHSKTPTWQLNNFLKEADLVVVAAGKPHLIKRSQCPKAIVIDVGINRDLEGKIVGDFDENSLDIANGAWSTPVPGGVGLLTRLALLKNCEDLRVKRVRTLESAIKHRSLF